MSQTSIHRPRFIGVVPIKEAASMPDIDIARACSLNFSLGCSRNALLSAEPEPTPFELSVFVGKFVDLEELILAAAGEVLAGIGRGPPNLQIQYLGILAEADMLLQGGGAKRASAADGALDEALTSTFVLDGELNVSANRGAITLGSYQPQTDPVVAVAGILEQTNGVAIARDRASSFGNDLFIAVVIEVGEGNAVPLMKFARARRRGNVDKFLPELVVKENIRQNVAVRWSSSAQVKIEKPVVIDIAEIGTHGIENTIQANFGGHVAKCPISLIVVELERFHVVRNAQLASQILLRRHVIAGHEKIRKSVIIIVEEPRREAHPGCLHACLLANFGESAIVVVVEKEIVPAKIGDIQIDEAVVIVVGRHHAL